MKSVIVGNLVENTGNFTTAHKLLKILRAHCTPHLVNTRSTNFHEFKDFLNSKNIESGIAIHALLGGPYLANSEIPFILLMPGTDLYEDAGPLYEKQKAHVLEKAQFIVVYNEKAKEHGQKRWPQHSSKFHVIEKSIDIPDPISFNLREQLDINENSHVSLLPASLREVKDPAFLLRAFHDLQEYGNYHLVVAGKILEIDYAHKFLKLIQESPYLHFVGELPRFELISAMKEANIVLNSSKSEGFSYALLEALSVGTPVMARDIEGNREVLDQGSRGILFSSSDDFKKQFLMIQNDPSIVAQKTKAAQSYIRNLQNTKAESTAYYTLLKSYRRSSL